MSVASSLLLTVALSREEFGRTVSAARGMRGASALSWLHGKNLVGIERKTHEWERGTSMVGEMASANAATVTKKLSTSPAKGAS